MIIYCHVVTVNNNNDKNKKEFLLIVNSLNFSVAIQFLTIHALIFISSLYFSV